MNNKWNDIEHKILEISRKELDNTEECRRKMWITKGILELVLERRVAKNRDEQRYKTIHRQIQNDR